MPSQQDFFLPDEVEAVCRPEVAAPLFFPEEDAWRLPSQQDLFFPAVDAPAFFAAADAWPLPSQQDFFLPVLLADEADFTASFLSFFPSQQDFFFLEEDESEAAAAEPFLSVF